MTPVSKETGAPHPYRSSIEQAEELQKKYEEQVASVKKLKTGLAMEALARADRSTITGLETSIYAVTKLLVWRGVQFTKDGRARAPLEKDSHKLQLWIRDRKKWTDELAAMRSSSVGVMGGSIPSVPEST